MVEIDWDDFVFVSYISYLCSKGYETAVIIDGVIIIAILTDQHILYGIPTGP